MLRRIGWLAPTTFLSEHPYTLLRMPDTPSIVINKVMPYRGQQEVWSNKYHFSGTTPSTDAEWNALALAIWGSEEGIVGPTTKYCGYLGYQAGNNFAVSIKDLIADGSNLPTGSGQTAVSTAGDQAVWVRWRTPDRNDRGQAIYLRKYFHGVGVSGDSLSSGVQTALAAHGAKMTSGTLPGSVRICGPQGAVAGAVKISPYVTTRTLKRRGKRPSR